MDIHDIIKIIIGLAIGFLFKWNEDRNVTKAYKKGENNVLHNIYRAHNWFNKDIRSYNLLILFFKMYHKYDFVDPEILRKAMEFLGDKRIDDYAVNEQDIIITIGCLPK